MEDKSWKSCSTPGSVSTYDIKPEYAAFLRKFAKMDRKLKVVVDYANAMGLYEIGGITDLFDIIPMYDVLDGTFPNHEANPLHLATLDAIRAKVVEVGADFGAAFDGDADRCGFIDNKGEIIPMDLFTALIAQDILSDGPATILYDLRSSRAVPECIRENGGKAIQSRVGHAFIKAQMRENDAVFAGELSGHYYFKENFTAECQGLAMIKLANLICKKNKPVDELVAPLRKYFSSGEINSTVADVKPILDAIRKKYADGNMHQHDLHQSIADSCLVRRPDLNIVDAFRVMTTGGPRGNASSVVKDLGGLLMSHDIVAVDTAAAKLAGFPLKPIGYLPAGQKLGLGTTNLEDLAIRRVVL